MMLMMPAMPAASNRADGLLMISIASMFAADTLSSPRWLPNPVRLDCRPSIRMATWSLPRSETLPFLVDGHARQVLHRVEHRAGRLRRTVVQPEHLRVDAGGADGLRGDRHLLLEALDPRQPDVAEVVRLVERRDQHVGLASGKPGNRTRSVAARPQSQDDEAAILTGEGAGQRITGLRTPDHDGREGDPRSVGGVDGATGDGGARLGQ